MRDHAAAQLELDHLLVSGLTVGACRYEHGWLEAGLSDRSPLVAHVHAKPPSRAH